MASASPTNQRIAGQFSGFSGEAFTSKAVGGTFETAEPAPESLEDGGGGHRSASGDGRPS